MKKLKTIIEETQTESRNALEHFYGGEPSAERRADYNMNIEGIRAKAISQLLDYFESLIPEEADSNKYDPSYCYAWNKLRKQFLEALEKERK